MGATGEEQTEADDGQGRNVCSIPGRMGNPAFCVLTGSWEGF